MTARSIFIYILRGSGKKRICFAFKRIWIVILDRRIWNVQVTEIRGRGKNFVFNCVNESAQNSHFSIKVPQKDIFKNLGGRGKNLGG
jgi:hypothetical protein